FWRRQTVFEKLNRHGLDLLKNDISVCVYHKSCIVKIIVRRIILSTYNQKFLVLPAPIFHFLRWRSGQTVFAQDKDFGRWLFLRQFFQARDEFFLFCELKLNSRNPNGLRFDWFFWK